MIQPFSREQIIEAGKDWNPNIEIKVGNGILVGSVVYVDPESFEKHELIEQDEKKRNQGEPDLGIVLGNPIAGNTMDGSVAVMWQKGSSHSVHWYPRMLKLYNEK